MVRKFSRSGLVIPTALFVAMFALLTITVLMGAVSYNSGWSMRSLETTEFRYLSLAASHELLSDMNAGLKPTTHTVSHPRRLERGGRITESWIEPIEGSDKNLFVVSRTYRDRSSSLAESVKILVKYQEHSQTRLYTNVIDSDKTGPDPIYYSRLSGAGAATWERLSDPPKVRYSDTGSLEYVTGEKAGTTPFLCGTPDGGLYVLYSPAMDGWDDTPSVLSLLGVPVVSHPWGDFALKTIVKGSQQKLTVGELAPIAQLLVRNVDEVTLSKGTLFMKFSHDDNQWTPLPPAEEATVVNGKFQIQQGNYRLQGVSGPPVAHEGGLTVPLFRKGQDAIYEYSDSTEKWSVIKPPATDVLLMTADQGGTSYVQTGELEPTSLEYVLNLVGGNLTKLYPNTPTTGLHRYRDGEWSPIPNPPSKFFNKDGQLLNKTYPGRGPTLGSMVGGKSGELFVVNHPPANSGLVDTIYKHSDGAWEIVSSPPNKYYDSSGSEFEATGLPPKLDICIGADGELVVRVPNDKGQDGIFTQTGADKAYELLPAVRAADGSFESYLSQVSVGRQKSRNGRGVYSVRATYF